MASPQPPSLSPLLLVLSKGLSSTRQGPSTRVVPRLKTSGALSRVESPLSGYFQFGRLLRLTWRRLVGPLVTPSGKSVIRTKGSPQRQEGCLHAPAPPDSAQTQLLQKAQVFARFLPLLRQLEIERKLLVKRHTRSHAPVPPRPPL